MFDVEYEPLVTSKEPRSVSLTREQLLQLSSEAMRGAQLTMDKWMNEELADLTKDILSNSETKLSRFMTWILGGQTANSLQDAKRIAAENISHYPNFMRCWEAEDTFKMATKWNSVVNRIPSIDTYDIPRMNYDDMINFASKL